MLSAGEVWVPIVRKEIGYKEFWTMCAGCETILSREFPPNPPTDRHTVVDCLQEIHRRAKSSCNCGRDR